jgi:hypothetical protein
MATVAQVQKGFAAFVDRYVAGAYTGVEKAIVMGATTLLAANFPNIVKEYAGHPMVNALGLYNAETGAVNIEALYNAIAPNLGADKIPITLPKMGSINLGTIKIGKEEIEELMRCIKEA